MDLGLGGIIAAVALVVTVVPLLVGGVFVILIVANRADVDATGRRPAVVYAYAVSFLTLFATLFASFAIVAQLTSLIGTNHGDVTSDPSSGSDSLGLFGSTTSPGGGPQHPVGDSVARAVVIAALIAIVAGFVHLRHVRAGERATAGLAVAEPAGRIRSSYLAAVSFVCVAIAVIATIVAAYQIFRIIGPGVFNSSGSGSRVVAFRTMIPLVYLAAASIFLLRRHGDQLPPEALPWSGSPPPPPTEPVDEPVAVTLVDAEVLDVSPPPRKRAPRKTTPKKAPPPPS
jgi:hypothetical protein